MENVPSENKNCAKESYSTSTITPHGDVFFLYTSLSTKTLSGARPHNHVAEYSKMLINLGTGHYCPILHSLHLAINLYSLILEMLDKLTSLTIFTTDANYKSKTQSAFAIGTWSNRNLHLLPDNLLPVHPYSCINLNVNILTSIQDVRGVLWQVTSFSIWVPPQNNARLCESGF